jgi:beta-alanine--pyruvate transaminase
MAAGIATLDVYSEQKLFEKADALAPYWEQALHSLKGLPHIVDIRNIGLMGAVEFTPIPGYPTKRATDIFERCFTKGLMVRNTGSTVAFSPPLICDKSHIDFIINTFSDAIVESSKQLVG